MTKTALLALERTTGVLLHHSKPTSLNGKPFSIGKAWYHCGDADRFCGLAARFRGHLFLVCYLPEVRQPVRWSTKADEATLA